MPPKKTKAKLSVTTSPALQEYKDGVNARMAERFAEQMIWFKANGVVMLCVDYDGSGDSGLFGEIVLTDKDHRCVEYQAEFLTTMAEMFESMTNRFDWWNNDGGCGEIVWDLNANTFKWHHSQRYSSSDDSEHGLEELADALANRE